MKFSISFIFILFSTYVFSQDESKKIYLFEYHYGFNTNAYTEDAIAEPFFDQGIGRKYGCDIVRISTTKMGRKIVYSASVNSVEFLLSPPNTFSEYEFRTDKDSRYRITIGNRRFWRSWENKTGPAIFPSIDLSTRLLYHLSDKFLFSANLSLGHAPFYKLDYTYNITSQDGEYEGLFHQKLTAVVLGIGIGMKL